MKRLGDFLGLNRNTTLLLAGIILINTGEETWMRFLPKYIETLGASELVIAIFDAIKTLLGAVYALPGGIITDHWGHRRAFQIFIFLSIAGYAFVLFTTSWIGVIAGMFLFLAWTNLSLPATFSLVARSLPASKHTMGIGIQSLIRRVPVLIGPVAGGMLIDRYGQLNGVHAAVAITIVLAALSLGLQSAIEGADAPAKRLEWNLVRLVKGFDPELRRLLLSDILIRFCERLPFAWVVIYAMNDVGLSATQTGTLIAIEMTAAILCYVPACYLADRHGKEPFVIATFICFTLFPLTLLAAHNFAMLAVAFVIRGLKEFGEPARKSLIISYSPPEARGQTIGAYYLVRDTLVTAGSFIGAALWSVSPQVNFIGAALVGLCGTVFYVRVSRQ